MFGHFLGIIRRKLSLLVSFHGELVSKMITSQKNHQVASKTNKSHKTVLQNGSIKQNLRLMICEQLEALL